MKYIISIAFLFLAFSGFSQLKLKQIEHAAGGKYVAVTDANGRLYYHLLEDYIQDSLNLNSINYWTKTTSPDSLYYEDEVHVFNSATKSVYLKFDPNTGGDPQISSVSTASPVWGFSYTNGTNTYWQGINTLGYYTIYDQDDDSYPFWITDEVDNGALQLTGTANPILQIGSTDDDHTSTLRLRDNLRHWDIYLTGSQLYFEPQGADGDFVIRDYSNTIGFEYDTNTGLLDLNDYGSDSQTGTIATYAGFDSDGTLIEESLADMQAAINVGDGIFDASNDGQTVPTSMNAALTDWIQFGNFRITQGSDRVDLQTQAGDSLFINPDGNPAKWNFFSAGYVQGDGANQDIYFDLTNSRYTFNDGGGNAHFTIEDLSGDNQARLHFASATKDWVMGSHGGESAFKIAYDDDNLATNTYINIESTGEVGFGTIAPTETVDVNGNIRLRADLYDSNNSRGGDDYILSQDAGGVLWKSEATAQTDLNYWTQSGTDLYYNTSNDVAIGTSTIESNYLHILNNGIIGRNTESDLTNKAWRLNIGKYDNSDARPFTAFYGSTSNGNNTVYFGGGTSLGDAATQVYFLTAANETTAFGTTAMTIDSQQEVGIGTTSPTQELDVNGNVRIRGDIYDSNNSTGATGEILSQDAGGVLWQSQAELGIENYWTASGSILSYEGTYDALETDTDNIAFNANGVMTVPISTEDYNIWIGHDVNYPNNSSFDDNIAIGREHLTNATSANNNFFVIGRALAQSVTTGQYNLIAGYQNMSFGATGDPDYNVSLGMQASAQLEGDFNIHQGYRAGYLSTTGSNNILFGREIAALNTHTGSGSIALGYRAGYSMSTTNYSVILGYGAGHDLTTGAENILIGGTAGDEITIGEHNIFIGEDVANSTGTDPDNNIGIGVQALADVTGDGNIAIGYQAGDEITSGTYQIAIGWQSFGDVGSTGAGIGNIGIGNQTFYNNVSGDYNVAIGYTSGQDLSGASANLNTLLGANAGEEIANAKENTVIGADAMEAAGASTDENTVLGYKAAHDITGDGNVIIGHETADGQTSISNELWIDNSSTSTPLIHGDFSANEMTVNGDLQVSGEIQSTQGNYADTYDWYSSNGTGQTVVEYGGAIDMSLAAVSNGGSGYGSSYIQLQITTATNDNANLWSYSTSTDDWEMEDSNDEAGAAGGNIRVDLYVKLDGASTDTDPIEFQLFYNSGGADTEWDTGKSWIVAKYSWDTWHHIVWDYVPTNANVDWMIKYRDGDTGNDVADIDAESYIVVTRIR